MHWQTHGSSLVYLEARFVSAHWIPSRFSEISKTKKVCSHFLHHIHELLLVLCSISVEFTEYVVRKNLSKLLHWDSYVIRKFFSFCRAHSFRGMKTSADVFQNGDSKIDPQKKQRGVCSKTAGRPIPPPHTVSRDDYKALKSVIRRRIVDLIKSCFSLIRLEKVDVNVVAEWGEQAVYKYKD